MKISNKNQPFNSTGLGMNAGSISKALGGRKAGDGWIARCPAHDDRVPSLSIRDGNDGKILVRCHAGCEQQLVIEALRERGLWEEYRGRRFTRSASRPAANDRPDRDDAKRTDAALAIWQSATQATGTLVETYFASRGINVPPPSTLRFHSRLKHRPSGQCWPAMVALVTRGFDGEPLGIHRTFLTRDGTQKAPVEPQKMMLGPCRGGGVWLAPHDDLIVIGEGIETALSVMQATGHPACAALSTGGLKTIQLPAEIRHVIIAADGDDAGMKAANEAAARFTCEGRKVRIAPAPPNQDFNDLLTTNVVSLAGRREMANA